MSDIRWKGFPHEELYRMINGGPGSNASNEMIDGWGALSTALTRIDEDLQKALTKVGADWEGSTAEQTTAALSPLAQWAADASTGSDVMKSSASIQADNIADARKKMPEPLKVTTEAPSGWDMALGAMTGPFGAMDVINQQQDHERQEAAQENAQAQAVKTMEDYESESTWNRDTLGEFNEPPQVVIDTPPPAGTTDPNANVGYQTSTPGHSNGNTGTTNTSWTAPPSGPPTSQPPTTTTPPPTDGTRPSWLDPKPQPPVTPPTTLPPGTPPIDKGGNGPIKNVPGIPPIFTRPDGTTGGRGPGGSGAGRGPGLGGPGGKAFGPMSGALSGTKGGVPGMTPGGLAGAMDDGHHGPANRGGAAAGAAGRGGAAGAAGGMGAGRGQGEGEDDIEHKAADYLVETEDVFGDERLVAPPVIGGAPEA